MVAAGREEKRVVLWSMIDFFDHGEKTPIRRYTS
jgi:hypothetical protein